ncbi:hypothetical protein [Staphylococcus aureus]|uniref:hypothetical protein n=1 Tax=Staphylococcus aureus TaxID=1280 RepID=UPI0028DDBA60|nr:hypothetical protein [Staphylococcus aureus]
MRYIWAIAIFIIMFVAMIDSIIKYIKDKEDNDGLRIDRLRILIVITVFTIFEGFILMCGILFLTFNANSIGYYQAEAKVMNIEKSQKVDDKTNYTFELRYINGVTVDKKTKPLKIKQKNRQGIKNGDKVLIKTSEKTFRGNEDKDIEISSNQKSDLTIQKP